MTEETPGSSSPSMTSLTPTVEDQIPEGVEVLLLEPRELYDESFLGLIHQGGFTRALYSRAKLADVLAQDPEAPVALYSRALIVEQTALGAVTDQDREEALEHVDFNVTGSMGKSFPWFLMDEDEKG